MVYPEKTPSTFSDFLSPSTTDEGPVRTKNLPRQRLRRKTRRRKRKQQREARA
jgi:hypothetical protein